MPSSQSSSTTNTTSSQSSVSSAVTTNIADSYNRTSNWVQNLSDVGNVSGSNNYTVNLAPPVVAGPKLADVLTPGTDMGSLLLPLGLGAVVLFVVIYFYTRK